MADVTTPTKLFSGGGGLASTTSDYLRFCQMLLNGGELDGVRILSPATVRRMTTNALPSGIRFAGYASGSMGPLAGSTWGLGVAVRSDAAWSLVPGSVGSFSWMGASGTYFWVDPAEQLIVVQMIHVSGGGVPFQHTLRNLAYGALRVPDQGIPASAPAAIDQAALASVEGTYRFESSSARDRQEAPEFGGLGIDVAMKAGVLNVVSPIANAPAAKAGVLSGDIITQVDGEPTQGMDLSQAIEKMRGLANTTIRLRIVRKGQDAPVEIEVVRGAIRRAGTGADLQVAARDGKLQIENIGDAARSRLRERCADRSGPDVARRVPRRWRRSYAPCIPARRGRQGERPGAQSRALADHRSADRRTGLGGEGQLSVGYFRDASPAAMVERPATFTTPLLRAVALFASSTGRVAAVVVPLVVVSLGRSTARPEELT